MWRLVGEKHGKGAAMLSEWDRMGHDGKMAVCRIAELREWELGTASAYLRGSHISNIGV